MASPSSRTWSRDRRGQPLLPVSPFSRPPETSRRRGRSGVSELYASLLMLGATISLGSVAAGLVANQLGLATSTAGSAEAGSANSAGIQVSYVFAAVSSYRGCPVAVGVPEGNVFGVTVFNYGSASFQPTTIVLNGTVYYSSAFPRLPAGAMATYRLQFPEATCAHPWGQSVLMVDAQGDEFQFET